MEFNIRLFPLSLALGQKHRPTGPTLPLRDEVLGAERLEAHARTLAESDQVSFSLRRGQPLFPRMRQNERALQAAQRRFAEAARQKQSVPPAAEWLLDNSYIVLGQFRQIERDLSQRLYRELPKLTQGPDADFPRIYRLALDLIAHTDSYLQADVITRYVQAYQVVAPLTSGELWGMAIMLRLGLVENLRRLIDYAQLTQQTFAEADRWADRLLALSSQPPNRQVVALTDLARVHTQLDPIFVIYLLERLRDQAPAISAAIQWLEQWQAEQGVNVEATIRAEHQLRAANRITVSNVITSMRTLSAIDWPAFFEVTSPLERVLRGDPAGAYAEMDFATRDRYRHQVERLSRRTRLTEVDVAERVIELARRPSDPSDSRQGHIGYYLLDKGLSALQSKLGYRPALAERLAGLILKHPTSLYLGAIVLLASLWVGAGLGYAAPFGLGLLGTLLLTIGLAGPAFAFSISVVNWLISYSLPPRVLPKLEFKNDIPAEHRTVVVVPVLLSHPNGIRRLLENLEIRFLANRDPHLHFALLGDFADAAEAHRPEDEALLRVAVDGVEELNARYGEGRADRFYLFHRRRCWNEREQTWMGWERKRGKLIEFTRLLRGAQDTNYVEQRGDLSILPEVRYVITLDADTELPLDSARRLIGTLSHPLNRPRLDPRTRCVTEGYGIIQPRTGATASAATQTRFAQLFAGSTGLDPYAQAASAVYPDLFGVGSYIGKAIYDVDAALAALDGRFPDNLLLSHDLLEGAHVRVGSASDIQLLEDFPSGYDAYIQRQHRWVRGDWQIMEWLFPNVPDRTGRRVPNPIRLIERWKIFDNLRQSLTPLATVLLLALGWLWLPGSALVWTTFALLPLLFPYISAFVLDNGVHPVGEPWSVFIRELGRNAALVGARALWLVTFLLFEALVNLDAITRVLVRRAFGLPGLLEWTRAAVAEHGQARTLADHVRRIGVAPLLALVFLALVAIRAPASLTAALPVLFLWLISPLAAYYVSSPVKSGEPPLPEEARQELRLTARRIWRFYETFAGPDDHWLPPDNFQQDPKAVIAHRTSPTNIGFLLLSVLSAYDFGYLTAAQVMEWFTRVFDTLDQLDRHRGHFLNWYDTLTLRPLYPEYVSTVDSGNLAASLLTVEQACLEIADSACQPLAVRRAALTDTLVAVQAALIPFAPGTPLAPHSVKQIAEAVEAIRTEVREHPLEGEPGWAEWLKHLADLAHQILDLAQVLDVEIGPATPDDVNFWAKALVRQIEAARAENGPEARPPDWSERWLALAQRAKEFVDEQDYAFLFDPEREIFAIGYNASTKRLDASYYDLLASEARLGSFVAIALGQIPAEHWFRLGRPFTWTGRRLAVLSWGGTMFEYLMPTLLLRDFDGTLLHQSVRAAIHAQQEYARQRGVPWGISESGFYAFDSHLNYQYQLFGVPSLSLKRGLDADLVVAPYATFLALPFTPTAAWHNLQRLAREGAQDGYGFYEAIDYTVARRPKGQRAGIVRSFMAHHQGMSLVALDNYLNDNVIQRRFGANPAVAATELILQERLPRHMPVLERHLHAAPKAGLLRSSQTDEELKATTRRFVTPHTSTPRLQLLSNGTYHVMVTNAGGGYSAYRPPQSDPAQTRWVTRWRDDGVRDDWGQFIYLRDLNGGDVWSTAYQPTARQPEHYEVIFSQDKVEFRRRDLGIETHTEITVSPQDNVEIRRVSLTNVSPRARLLEVTSYGEVALEAPRADMAHPAFSKLFVESEAVPERRLLLFKRRMRAADQPPLWAVHMLTSSSPLRGEVGYETDRARFVGRGRTLRNPQALSQALSKTSGAVLDPILSLRCRLRLAPGQTVHLAFTTGVADSREAALALADRYGDERAIENTFDLAWAYMQIQLRHLDLTPEAAHLIQRLASRVLYPDPALRAAPDLLAQNTRGQSGLWAYGISGDYPIVLVKIDEVSELGLVRQVLHAHEFWRSNNFIVDLVILNQRPASYVDDLQARLQGMVDASLSRPWLDKPGGIHLRKSDLIAPEDKILLQTVARVILEGGLGELADQLAQSRQRAGASPLDERRSPRPPPSQVESAPHRPAPVWSDPRAALLFFNGLGGFSVDGREYVIVLEQDRWTPAPWINVLANPDFGCLVSESGLGYTWAENSQNNRLTPWSNDPVSDPSGEAIYLFDEETNELWSPTPLPIRTPEPYVIRHGAGYSIFEHTSHGLFQKLWVSVPPDAPVKVMRLRLRNTTRRTRHLAITGYAEWVLGEARTAPSFIVTEADTETQALFARNTYHPELSGRVAFAACTAPEAISPRAHDQRARFSLTSDRAEFLGRNGALTQPAGLGFGRLSGRTGAGFDSCAALQTRLELQPGEEKEWVFLLGQGRDQEQARALARRYRVPDQARQALDAATAHWDEILETVQVRTPDQAFNILLNRWLLYQTLACRVWARSAFYQSSGAYGFRDQLQDVMALVFARPDLAREHIVRAAARQFAEGDVQHWWHPTSGQGVRTHFSDDYLWLVFVTTHYVRATGDTDLLNEEIPFIDAAPLGPGASEAFLPVAISGATGTLYEHCRRALDHALERGVGEHGLPLIGTGDWNDGMNRVGPAGKGESVWLGWFMSTTLTQFSDLVAERGDEANLRRWRDYVQQLQPALEAAWDGAWYRRGYFDDGSPLGSRQNMECQIDSIAQSWAALSLAAPSDRVRTALESVEQYLVNEAERLILLLTPPFNQSQPEPGYIQGYVPGIRENGGQYTHAALWVVWAYVVGGQGDRAAELFRLLNPISHALTPAALDRYKVEPYVIAADVYSHPQHMGRGGWTWYTGSASWMYRLGLEGILGLQRRGPALVLDPCLPRNWPRLELDYRYGSTRYVIEVENPKGVNRGVTHVELDGEQLAQLLIPLTDDKGEHRVRIVIG